MTDLLTTAEALNYIGREQGTLWRWMRNGWIQPADREGPGTRPGYRFLRADLDAAKAKAGPRGRRPLPLPEGPEAAAVASKRAAGRFTRQKQYRKTKRDPAAYEAHKAASREAQARRRGNANA